MKLRRKQSETDRTITILEELIVHIKNVRNRAVEEITYSQVQPNPIASLTTSLLQKRATSFSFQKGRMSQVTIREQVIKFKNVNSYLEVIDTNLEDVVSGIECIYSKIKEYQPEGNRQDELNSNEEQKIIMKKEQISQQGEDEVFQNTFKLINDSIFKDSFDTVIEKPPKQLAIWLLEIQMKLALLPELIGSARKFKSDITTCSPSTEKYSYAWKKIRIVDMDNTKETVKGQIQLLKRLMKITTSAVVTEIGSLEFDLIRKAIFGLSFPYYWIADQESKLKCYKLWRKPKLQALNSVWNLPENGAIKQCKKIVFPSIQTHTFIYVPANYSQIKNIEQKGKWRQSEYRPEIFQQPENTSESVRVLVLYYRRLKYTESFSKYEPFICFSCLDVAEEEDLETIMIHFHGGGFVALSSQTSQSYTRKWANELKIPIFSVDYRKPPKFRFPTALEDCVDIYKFIVENIHKYFKIRPRNIIVTGDSAGGNLAVSMYASLLQEKYPILPTGMFLAYPAVDLRIKFSPSRLNSFDDAILLPPLLLLCLTQYLGENTLNQENPLASPILLSEHFINTEQPWQTQISSQLKKWPKNWPKTTIMVGKRDPLYDDSLRLLQRMTQAGVDAKLIIYSQLSHAFLSLDNVIEYCASAINDSIQEIRKLL